jgi:fumarate reductase flavoprotein subunit
MEKSKNKVLGIIAAAALVLVCVAAGTYPSWKPVSTVSGEFTGTAKGMGGDVTVTLTIKDNVITDVKAEGKNETKGIGTKALEALPKEMITGNSVDVDGISGATVTSDAIKKAAEQALSKAGLTAKDLAAVASDDSKQKDVTKDTDVVIVGAGGAGMTAAITAAEDGKSVIVLESQDTAGGNSVRSTGGMNAAKTSYQDDNTWNEAGEEEALKATISAARTTYADNADIQTLADTVEKQYAAYDSSKDGYFDSVELMELDTMIGGHGINDPELVKTLAEDSSDAIDWVNEQASEADGSKGLTSVGQFGGASVKRIHRPVDDSGKTTAVGAYLVPILEANLESKGVDIMYNTTANKILMDDGKAVGIQAEGKTGNTVTINAKSVVIATGGFGANNKMVAEENPDLEGYITTNAAGAQGQGITMATAKDVDAATVDMDQIQLHPTVHVDDDGNAHLITEGLRGDGAILVNQEGKRFTNEVGTRDVVSAAENKQTDGKAWLIVDQTMVDASAVIQGYVKNGYTVQGDTVEDLAKAMNTDSDTLVKTMNDWNTCVQNQSDPDFGRTSFVKQLNEGPYYAITVQPGIHHTMGGLKIDTKTEVLNESGEAIPGLFAAGEVTGGVHGANRLGGNAVTDFVVFGRIAGAAASDYAE